MAVKAAALLLAVCAAGSLPTAAGAAAACNTSALRAQGAYSVAVVARDPVPDGAALISHVNGTSDFNFSFTTAWFPSPSPGQPDGLIVRVVECNANHHTCTGVPHPEWTNAGALVVVGANLSAAGPPTAEVVTLAGVTWAGAAPPPPSTGPRWGAADPRLAYRPADRTYYLTWDNCTTK